MTGAHQPDEANGAHESAQASLSRVTSAVGAVPLSEAAFSINEATHKYPTGMKLAVILISLYISVFLIALDRTIIGVAVPKITNEFHSINDIGWYGSSYMLTASAFILFYGRVYTFFKTKPVFLTGIFIFAVGSAVCGAAPNSTTFIVGRAIAGFGSSGIFTGAITIMIFSVPLHRRPLLQGLFGACFGVASVAGPLIGGAFTEGKAGWRWCFYINLPLSAATIAILILFLHIEDTKPPLKWGQMLMKLDPLGNLFFLPSIICLILALQWGGIEYAWSNGRVIALFVVFGVIFVAWCAVQYFERHDNATVPSRILLQRSVLFGGIFQFMLGAAFFTTVFYIPLWFQAIKNTTPVKSGIDTIPMILALVIASILAGGLVHRIGYYTQFLYIGAGVLAIGSGLITTWKVDTNHSKWIGYQVIAGLGIGMSMQQSNIAVQTCVVDADVPTGTAIIFFFQTLGGAVFNAVGQNVFIDKFLSRLLETVPDINPQSIIHTGATELRNIVSPESLPQVIEAYNYSLTHGPFLVSTILACLAIFGAAGMEWRSVKEKKAQQMGTRRRTKDVENDAVSASESAAFPRTSDEEKKAVSPVEPGSSALPHSTEKEAAA